LTVTDLSAVVQFAKVAFLKITGYGADEIRGRKLQILQGEMTDRGVVTVSMKRVCVCVDIIVCGCMYVCV